MTARRDFLKHLGFVTAQSSTTIKIEPVMTEEQKVQELLKPRWRVSGPYPNSPYKVGDLVNVSDHGSFHITTTTTWDEFGELVVSDNWEPVSKIKDYPTLFTALPWHEERDASEMPEYVKLNPENTSGGPEVFNVLAVKVFVDGIGLCHTSPPDDSSPFENFVGAKYFLPATSAEYQAYIEKQPTTLNQGV